MNEKPAVSDRPFLLKHTTQTLPARLVDIRHRVDIHTLGSQPADELRLNEIGVVLVETQRPVFVDPYRRNRFTGSFILLDPLTNETVGAGMIDSVETGAAEGAGSASLSIEGRPEVLWTLARMLADRGHPVSILPPEVLLIGPVGSVAPLSLHVGCRIPLH